MTDILTHNQLKEVLMETRRGLIAIFGEKLEKLWLYGSYARGEATPESDIDVMALVNMSREELSAYQQAVSKLASDIDLEYDVLLSVKPQDAETFWRFASVQPFYANVLADGIELLDVDIGQELKKIPKTVSFKLDVTRYEEAKSLCEAHGITLEEVLLHFAEGLGDCGGEKEPFKGVIEDCAIMAASARILDKYHDAFIALGGVKDVLAAREERANGYAGRHAEDVLSDIDKILDGFTDDFFENGREQAVLNQEELNRGSFDI